MIIKVTFLYFKKILTMLEFQHNHNILIKLIIYVHMIKKTLKIISQIKIIFVISHSKQQSSHTPGVNFLGKY